MIHKILWLWVQLMASLGWVILLVTLFSNDSSGPAQAVGFSLAIGAAAVPYVMARAWDEFRG